MFSETTCPLLFVAEVIFPNLYSFGAVRPLDSRQLAGITLVATAVETPHARVVQVATREFDLD